MGPYWTAERLKEDDQGFYTILPDVDPVCYTQDQNIAVFLSHILHYTF